MKDRFSPNSCFGGGGEPHPWWIRGRICTELRIRSAVIAFPDEPGAGKNAFQNSINVEVMPLHHSCSSRSQVRVFKMENKRTKAKIKLYRTAAWPEKDILSQSNQNKENCKVSHGDKSS